MDFSFKVRVGRHICMWVHVRSYHQLPKKSISGFLMSLRMRLTYPRPLRLICDWLAVFVTRSGPLQGHKGQAWKLSLEEKKKWNDERRATGRGYRLMVSSKQTEKRNRVLGEKETNVERVVLLHWLKGLRSWQNIWCTRSVCCFCRLQLVSRFNASFLCVLI